MSAADEACRRLEKAEHDLRHIRNSILRPDAPRDVAVAPSGLVYVADSQNNRRLRFVPVYQ